jgi:hypothetical protein
MVTQYFPLHKKVFNVTKHRWRFTWENIFSFPKAHIKLERT